MKTFLTYSLPMQFFAGNLGSFIKSEAIYHLYTTKEDLCRLQESPLYYRLEEITTLHVHLLALNAFSSDKYALMNRCHCDALQRANRENAPLITIAPDSLMLEGAFKKVRELAGRGIRAVMVAGVRLNLDSLRKEIEGHSIDQISHKEWVALALRHLHPLVESCIWGRETMNEWISHLYWRPSPNCLLIRGFHQHPFLIWPERPDIFPKISLDDSFLAKACPNPEKWHVVQTVDEMVILELSRASAHAFATREMAQKDLAYWILRHTGQNHRRYVLKPYLLSETANKQAAAGAIEESQKVIEHLLRMVEKPSLCFLQFAGRKFAKEILQRASRRFLKK